MGVAEDLQAGWTLPVDSVPIAVGRQVLRALERAQHLPRALERRVTWAPGGDRRHDLARLVAAGEVAREPPRWVRPARQADGYWRSPMFDDMCAPLVWSRGELVATVVLDHSGEWRLRWRELALRDVADEVQRIAVERDADVRL
ncbi:MAG: hypothetical protein ACLP01_08045 [Solirubrobacteraceae bacterium]